LALAVATLVRGVDEDFSLHPSTPADYPCADKINTNNIYLNESEALMLE
jgi:hypothetical protein